TAESLELEGELIFAGFGYSSGMKDPENLMPRDLQGKIVLYSAGSPSTHRDGTSGSWNSAEERKKMDYFFENGAKALILVTSFHDSSNTTFNHFRRMSARQSYSFQTQEDNDRAPVFIITPETADELTGRRFNWRKVLQGVSEHHHPGSFKLKNKKIAVKSLQKKNSLKAANVVGFIEGSDSLLKNECVVFRSHYDHLGTSKQGEIYNGADDNASGVATLLEVANMFAGTEKKPLRSMLFLFPAAEEIGLFGSDYY